MNQRLLMIVTLIMQIVFLNMLTMAHMMNQLAKTNSFNSLVLTVEM